MDKNSPKNALGIIQKINKKNANHNIEEYTYEDSIT
jgi:hypothetical protein